MTAIQVTAVIKKWRFCYYDINNMHEACQEILHDKIWKLGSESKVFMFIYEA